VPDLIIHKPGEMNNAVVIEVKSLNTKNWRYKKLESDLKKINDFLKEYNYKKGVILVFGNKKSLKKETLKRKITNKFFKYLNDNRIMVFWQKEPSKEPENILST